MEQFVQTLVDAMDNSALPQVIVFIISMLPIVELRGGMIAAQMLGLDIYQAFFICAAGTLLPVPFILLFIRKIFQWMKKTRFVTFVRKMEAKAEGKIKKINQYRNWGLFIFVAVPLPGTGAWMGSLAAVLMDMRFKSALISITAGTLVADLLMSILAYGVLGHIL